MKDPAPFTEVQNESFTMNNAIHSKLRHTGYITFFLSGICAISSGVVVSLLKDRYGFSFSLTGTLLSAMSVGNMVAGFICGLMTSRIGMRPSILILALGYPAGYAMMSVSGLPGLLLAAFLLVGFAKGSVMNTCTVLVGSNTGDRAKSMTLMHSCYAAGALICPFLINAFTGIGTQFTVLSVAAAGLLLWCVYLAALPKNGNDDSQPGDAAVSDNEECPAGSAFSFLSSTDFWLLTLLLFCQNAAEQSVNGWVVTYFKDNGILTGTLATYTISIMWGATLAGRLFIAFALKIRNIFRALSVMGLACTVLYFILVQQTAAIPAGVFLFLFAFAMSGVNPLAVAAVGKDLSAASAGVLLPIGSIGAVVMPYIIGRISDTAGLTAGMQSNLVPCCGIFLLSVIMLLRKRRHT